MYVGRDRFLAAAFRCADPTDTTADCPTSNILMASRDGVHWSILGDLPGSDATRRTSISTIQEDERGLFLGGLTVSGTTTQVGLWWSADGTDWKSLTDQPAFTSSACDRSADSIGAFYPIGDSLIAVGSAAWRSIDGQTWQCLGPVPDLRVTGGHDLLVGAGGTDPTSADNFLWLSRDGVSWQQTTETPDFMTPTPVADGFVALGQSFQAAPTALLTSADGETWTQQPVPFGTEILNENGRLESDGTRTVVVEDAPQATAESPGDVWVSSTDGSTWTRYPLPRHPSDYAQFSAVLGDRVVVAGDQEPGSAYGDELIWTATIP